MHEQLLCYIATLLCYEQLEAIAQWRISKNLMPDRYELSNHVLPNSPYLLILLLFSVTFPKTMSLLLKH